MRPGDLRGFGPVGTNGPQSVDVLAVLDETYGLLAGPAADRLEQARAAVAELVEAAKLSLGAMERNEWDDASPGTMTDNAFKSLTAALVKFGGVA